MTSNLHIPNSTGIKSTLFVPNQPISRPVKSPKLFIPFQLRSVISHPFGPSSEFTLSVVEWVERTFPSSPVSMANKSPVLLYRRINFLFIRSYLHLRQCKCKKARARSRVICPVKLFSLNNKRR